jgi:uncharacterized membrane protein YhaH (DUF805 family)
VRTSVSTIVNLLFGYDGRLSRLYCWLGFLAFCGITGFFVSKVEDAVAGTGDIGRYVAFAFIVGTSVWIHSAVVIKRLHDRNKSGWWYLAYGVAPLVLLIAAISFYTDGVLTPAWILFALAVVGLSSAIIELGFLRGTNGPNRFGPAP